MPATTERTAFVELNEKGDRINVWFHYDPEAVAAVKRLGARFKPKEKGGPYWHMPLDIRKARKLRKIFPGLTMGNAVRAWAQDEVQRERNLGSLTLANDADLSNTPAILLDLFAGKPMTRYFTLPPLPTGKPHPLMTQRPARTYQRADVAMMAQASVINANQPGTGKTVEVIGAWYESKLITKPHLVIAPVRSLDNVWRAEVERYTDLPVFTSEVLADRKAQAREGVAYALSGKPCVVCVNPDMVRAKRLSDDDVDEGAHIIWKDHKGVPYGYRDELAALIGEVQWGTVTIDEFHKFGLNSTKALFKIGMSHGVKAERRWALSGTPMGGKPIKLFPVLQWCQPERFTSKWRWAEDWLDINDNGYGKTIGGIIEGREDEFAQAHLRDMVRRLKREALPGMPPKVVEVVECDMTPKQAKQYAKFNKDAEVTIEAAGGLDGSTRVVGTCILAEYTRLKQFANAYCEIDGKGDVVPTPESGKLPRMLDKLDEFGVRADDPEPGARAIVASESKRMANMVAQWLNNQGIDADPFTGDTKDSKPIINRFQGSDPKPYVIVMTTQTGGVSLNLEAAGSVHVLDETWNPDDQEQLEDRGDRGGRTTPLVCVYYRTTGTVQEYVSEVTTGKALTNAQALDLYRRAKG